MLIDCFFQEYKHRNLRQILEDITAFEKGEDDKSHGRKEGLMTVVRKRFGRFGKGVILTGFDFLRRGFGGIQKRDYVFSLEELAAISDDDSLSEEEKARCLFNALSFQHYEFPIGCHVTKETNGTYHPDSIERQNYFNGKLQIAISRGIFSSLDYNVGIYLNLPKFQATNFEFSGENSRMAGVEFYSGLEETLNG